MRSIDQLIGITQMKRYFVAPDESPEHFCGRWLSNNHIIAALEQGTNIRYLPNCTCSISGNASWSVQCPFVIFCYLVFTFTATAAATT